MKTATNKRLLISENRDDSNRCTLYKGKPNQYVTHFSHLVHVWPSGIRISHDPHIVTFYEIINIDEQNNCSREKGLLTQFTAR
jgi:hypothetical protein